MEISTLVLPSVFYRRFGGTALDALLSHVRFAMPDETVQMNSLKFTNAIFIIKEFF